MDQCCTIDRIELYEIAIPFRIPFEISGGVSHYRRSIVVKLTDKDGCSGYGEAAPFEQPFYSSEIVDTTVVVLEKVLIPRILGRSFSSVEELNLALNEGIRGNHFAKASLETAYWDLLAERNQKTFVSLIKEMLAAMGVAPEFLVERDVIESGVSIGIPKNLDLGILQEQAAEFAAEGYRRVKIKIRPGWDVQPAKAVRRQIGDDFPFWLDGNGAYNLPEHAGVFQALDEVGCLFYEQPLAHNDLWQHSKLSRLVETPVCLDESLESFSLAQSAVEMKAAAVWNIKLQRVGGLWEALQIYKLAMEQGIKIWGGTMPESGLGAMPMIAFASLSGFAYPSDIEPSSRWYEAGQDLIELHMDEAGCIKVPQCFGTGFDGSRLKEIGKRIAEFR